jgi:hypothetical protein
VRLTRKQLTALAAIHREVFGGTPLMPLEVEQTGAGLPDAVRVVAWDDHPRDGRIGGEWLVDRKGGTAQVK